MKVDFTVNAETRSDAGKGASRRLRHSGKIPAVVYGAGKEAASLSLSHNEMFHHLENESFYSHILSLTIDGKKPERVVLKDVQRHPAKPRILHVDFQRVSETDKLHMHVPLHFVGEDVAPGVKAGGLISHQMTGLDVACLAKNLPEYIEVDVSGLETGGAIHLSEIKLPKGVEIPALAQGEDHDLPVVSIHTPRGSVDEEPAAGEAAPAAAE